MSDPATLDEKVGHPSPERHKLAPWRQLISLLSPPLLFSGQILASFTTADSACTRDLAPGPALLIFNLLILAALVGVLVLSWCNAAAVRRERRSGLQELHDLGDGRTAFLTQFGFTMSALFAIASLVELVAILVLGACVGSAPSL
ncbi:MULTISPECIES: hypothetical protein [Sphingomonas]|uniref:hypothetical protein n=1 Tax=Sphingomonas TaxID=13687 RepID=UPI000DEEAB69|nr:MULTISPECIES: hypothetical protein [Sphingomonas]